MRLNLEVVNPNIFSLRTEQCSAAGKLPGKTTVTLNSTDMECKYLVRLPQHLVPDSQVGAGLCSAPSIPASVLSEAERLYTAETISVDHSYAQTKAKYPPCPVVRNGVVPPTHR